MKKGKFITFEGPEGSGKTTQTGHLKNYLETIGHVVERYREPGATPLGEEVRIILQHHQFAEPIGAQTELLLFEAARAQLVQEKIRPTLENGNIVLCDRYDILPTLKVFC